LKDPAFSRDASIETGTTIEPKETKMKLSFSRLAPYPDQKSPIREFAIKLLTTARIEPARWLSCVHNLAAAFAVVLLAGGFCPARITAAPGNVDLSFDPGSDIDQPVNTVLAQSDGKLLIGGYFSVVRGVHRRGVARLEADGTLDESFDIGPVALEGFGAISLRAAVHALVEQADGRILIGGAFSQVNGAPLRGVARLHP
jgi:hypothetical protein